MEKETIDENTTSISLDQKLRKDALEITLREGQWRRMVALAKEMESTLPIRIIIPVIKLEATSQYNRLLGIHLYHVLKQVEEESKYD